MTDKKNIKQKLQEARMLLKKESLTKSGKNSFLGNSYYQLSDIQPAITKVCNEVGICPIISFTNNEATMTIMDFESEEKLEIKTPMSEITQSSDRKKSSMQELMSTETYARRALNLSVFEIVEDDVEEQSDNLEKHNILMIKTRIERTMTQLMQKGFEFDEVLKKIGLDEKKYNGSLNFCNSLNVIEKNMQILLQQKD